MKLSTDRILTTHVGSLPRPVDLFELLQQRERGEPYDPSVFASHCRGAVAEVVRRQVEAGIDVVTDGELTKLSFVSYINHRLAGAARGTINRNPWGASREVEAFPEFYKPIAGPSRSPRMLCVGPLSYIGEAQLAADIEALKASAERFAAVETFMPAISPTNVEDWFKNEYYGNEDDYLHAIADAMRVEYLAIAAAGLLVQIDDPRLASYYTLNRDVSVEECRRWAEKRVEVLNYALRGIPADRVRFHTCYSIDIGPRIHDIELRHILDILLKINAGAYSFEAANPRHEHEWRLWTEAELPDHKVLIPGVISHTTVLVEHPELVADRIERFARAVGRERVIAGVDCGFASFAGSHGVHPTAVWPKLEALVRGAELASERLWRR